MYNKYTAYTTGPYAIMKTELNFHLYMQKFVSLFIGKVHPRTGHKVPEGEKMRSSTLPSTSVLDGGGRSTPCPGCFTPGKDPVPIVQEAGWAPGPVGMGAENFNPTGVRSPGCAAHIYL
jgi:hypothetical protein